MMKNQSSFRWSEKFRIGLDWIDQDHQYIFSLWHQAGRVVQAADNSILVYQLLNNLLNFSQMHFRDEEALMQSICFAGYGKHTTVHQILLQKAEDLLENLKRGYPVSPQDLLVLLEDWIESDILKEDLQVGQALAGGSDRR